MEASKNNLNLYYGDIHNHCAVGYGHGSVEDAYQNAKLQLDFVSVTPHAMWHDMPQHSENPSLEYVKAYSKTGFAATKRHWQDYLRLTEEWNKAGDFITFPGFEWHSMQYGDHQLLFNYSYPEMVIAKNISELHSAIKKLQKKGLAAMAIPHHIGYPQGFRGVNWEVVDEAITPLVEIY